MALEIFKLVGSIFVDSDAADKSLQKTDKKAQGVGEKFSNGIKTAAKWGTAIVGGATAAVAGITKFAAKTADTTDNIDKMSQKIGISRKAYQELDFITSQCGMDVDKFQTGMKTLRNVMDSTRDGTSKSATALEQLGISATTANGELRNSEEVMYEAINKLQGMSNETERAKLATELFGKAGSEMAPLLNAGAGSMEEMRKKANELGLVLGDDVVDSGVKLHDTLDQLKRSGGAILTKLGGAVMPLVQKVADYIIGAMPKIEKVVSTLSPIIQQLFDGLVPPLMNLASEIFPTFITLLQTIMPTVTQLVSEIIPIIVTLLKKLLPPIVKIVQVLLPPLLELLTPILDLLTPLLDLLDPILDLVVALLDPLASLISNLLTPLISVITKLINKAIKPLKVHFGFLSDLLQGTVKTAFDGIMNSVNTIKGVFSGLIKFIKGVFTGNWKSAWNGVKQIFSSVFDGMKNAFKIPINWIIDGINSFTKALSKIKIPKWVPAVGGKGFNIPAIPRLYKGGVLEKGQMGYLEGDGAEAVVPLDENKKWIKKVAADMNSEVGSVGGNDKIISLLTLISQLIEELIKAGIYLSTGELVGALAGPLDKKLGEISAKKARA